MSMRKGKKTLRVIIILICAAALAAGWLAFCGYQWSWGPFAKLHDYQTSSLAGNAAEYAPEQVQPLPESTLSGKKIIFLGSSVTYGASAKGVSFADYIAKRNNCTAVKEAVSGTTLVDEGINSYIERLRKLNEDSADLFVCQLSTNDATQGKELGKVSDSFSINDFDTHTVAGAIEYIIAYAQDKWGCPVVFYTNPKYDSAEYGEMVDILYDIAQKWDAAVIDMWSDAAFNDISAEQRALYMADDIHPTQAGYLEWWTPFFEEKLEEVINHESNQY